MHAYSEIILFAAMIVNSSFALKSVFNCQERVDRNEVSHYTEHFTSIMELNLKKYYKIW